GITTRQTAPERMLLGMPLSGVAMISVTTSLAAVNRSTSFWFCANAVSEDAAIAMLNVTAEIRFIIIIVLLFLLHTTLADFVMLLVRQTDENSRLTHQD